MKLQYKPNDLKLKLENALKIAQEEYDKAYAEFKEKYDHALSLVPEIEKEFDRVKEEVKNLPKYKERKVNASWWCFWKDRVIVKDPVLMHTDLEIYSRIKVPDAIEVGWVWGWCSRSSVAVLHSYPLSFRAKGVYYPTDHKIHKLKSTLNSLDTSAEYVYIDGKIAELIKGE